MDASLHGPGADRSARPLDAADLAAIQAAYDRGRYLDAWHLAQRHGPLASWQGAAPLVLAGRLASQLGAPRLGARLHLRAYRQHPTAPGAWEWAVRAVRSRRGPLAARAALARLGRGEQADADAATLAAELATDLLDFEEAERQLARATALAPADPWLHVVRALAHRGADGFAAALEETDRALTLRPWYRPAVELRADLLQSLGRDGEALQLLREASGRLQAASLETDRSLLEAELGHHAEAEAALDRVEALAPLGGRAHATWLRARRSDVAYLRGDMARALALARGSGSPFHERLAERLASAAARRRVVLPVPWVRQHQLTCAPATLSALLRHFGVAAEHLRIAEAICYDGTPDTAQREWALAQGLVAREFTVTWEAAIALLDRGVPFALTTVDPGSGHMQAVVGYDLARETLLLRDPSTRYQGELVGIAGLHDYAHCGPKGIVVLPRGEAHRLDGLELPEEALHLLAYRVASSLAAHARPAAAEAAAELARAAPGHRLGHQAERALAGYDGDEARRLRATEALLACFPDEVNLRLSKQASLADLGRRDARIEWLRAEVARAPHPLLQLALCGVLREDARSRGEALRLARAAVARGWRNAAAYHALAGVLWDGGAREDALAAYRAAACLERTSERYAESYFRAARLVRRAPEALGFLRDRFERHRRKAAGPAITLQGALDLLERVREGLEVLDQALASRPDDGDLLLYAARARALLGDGAAAEALVERARTLARPRDVARVRAELAEARGDLAEAAALWSEVVDAEPFDVGAVRTAARLIGAVRDPGAAVAFLRERVERHPHHHLLAEVLAEWLGDGPPAEREAAIRRILDVNPSDAWAWRELALVLAQARRAPEAEAALARAAEIDPLAPSCQWVRAVVLEEAGRAEDAKEALRDGLRLAVDAGEALRDLLRLSTDAAERERNLRFVHDEIVRQVLSGEALLAYQAAAAGVLDPERLAAELREAWEARPDLWHAWVALARQLLLEGRVEEGLRLLGTAAERFDLLPRVWVEVAAAHRAAGDRAAQRTALERALAISPGWPEATVHLAEALHAAGEYAAEREALGRAIRRSPGDAILRGWLADACWAAADRDAAVAELEQALRLDPGYAWAWGALGAWSRARGEPGRPLAAAERIAGELPRDPNAWVLLARARADVTARLEAVERALALAPRHGPALELRVELLAEAGRYDDALAAAEAPGITGRAGRSLRLLAARIRARRGERGLARLALQELLAAEPDFADGWAQLAEWLDEEGRHAEGVDAARRLVRLAPNDAMPHGYLGHALLQAGEREAGKAALRRAVQLDPAYVWGLRRLAGAELDDLAPAAAEEALALLERHAPADAAVGRVRAAAIRDEAGAALAAFGTLARREDPDRLAAAAEALDGAGWAARLDALLVALLHDPGASRAAGALLARRPAPGRWPWLARRRRRACLEAALSSPAPSPAALGAAEEVLGALASPPRARALRRFLARVGPGLARDAGAWGHAGYALLESGQRERAARWLADWRGRTGLEPWMLLNVAAALRDLGRDADAAEASAAAVALPPDGSTRKHEIMLALDAALAGDLAPVGRLAGADRDLGRHYGALLDLARAIAASAAEGDRRTVFRTATELLRAAAARRGDQRWSADPYLARAVRAALRRIVRNRAGASRLARLWWYAAVRVSL